MTPLLEIQGLTVGYGRTLAAWAVDLALAPGEVLGLVGESGAGKSTVGRAAVGLLPEGARVLAGTVRYQGRDLLTLPERERRRLRGAELALVPQDPLSALNPVFRVGFQATDGLVLHRGLSREAARRELARLLERMGLADPEDVLRRYPHELSGGMRQRVLLAMAFACGPRLLVADEPTTALDVTTQAQILRLLRALQAERGVATLFVTHDLGVVAHVADRVAVMYAGCVVESAPTVQLFAGPAHPYTRALLRLVPRVDARGDPGVAPEGPLPRLLGPPVGCPYRARCPERLASCEQVMPGRRAVGPGHQVACHLYPEASP